MAEKEYIVSLNRGVDAADFAAEMTQSTGSSTIPNRSVDVADSRLGSYRNTHYSLSEEEDLNFQVLGSINNSSKGFINIP